MNKLEITKKVNTFAGTQGEINSIEAATGYQATLVAMVDKAYHSIQIHREDWKFLQAEINIPLSTSVNTYINSLVAKVHRILYDKRELKFVEYDEWLVTDHITGIPSEYTINEATGGLTFNPSDTDYIVSMQYHKVPDTITASTDIPIIPVRFHFAIVYQALIHLGAYLENQALITDNATEFSIEMGRLMRSQVPQKKFTTGAFA